MGLQAPCWDQQNTRPAGRSARRIAEYTESSYLRLRDVPQDTTGGFPRVLPAAHRLGRLQRPLLDVENPVQPQLDLPVEPCAAHDDTAQRGRRQISKRGQPRLRSPQGRDPHAQRHHPRVVDTRTRRPRRPAPRRVADQQRLAAVLTSSTAPVVPMTVSRITTPCTIRRTSACCGTRCVACCGRRGGRTGHYAVGGWRQWRHLSREVKKLFNKVRSTRRAQRHPERVEAYVARCRALVERAETTLDALDFSPGPGRVERRRRGYRPWVGPVASFRATPQSHRPYPVSCERSSNRASRFPAPYVFDNIMQSIFRLTARRRPAGSGKACHRAGDRKMGLD